MTPIQTIFSLAADYREPDIIHQHWEWPTGTFFQRRRKYLLTQSFDSSNTVDHEEKTMPKVRLQVGTENR